MDEVTKLTRNYPRFPDGRIDYTNERVCLVVNCTVVCGDEVLLAHRSAKVIAYPNTWNGISGFIDEIRPLEELVRQELAEEVGIGAADIAKITIRSKMVQVDEAINREWHVFPVLVELKRKPEITTNWENKEAKWVKRSEVLQLELMPFYAETFGVAVENSFCSDSPRLKPEIEAELLEISAEARAGKNVSPAFTDLREARKWLDNSK